MKSVYSKGDSREHAQLHYPEEKVFNLGLKFTPGVKERAGGWRAPALEVGYRRGLGKPSLNFYIGRSHSNLKVNLSIAGNKKGVSVWRAPTPRRWMSARAETRTCILYRYEIRLP